MTSIWTSTSPSSGWTRHFDMNTWIRANTICLSILKWVYLWKSMKSLTLWKLQILDQIWKPNTVFINSKSANIHKSPFKNVFLMIYPNGTVWVNYRVQVKGPCSMDFSAFPMDQQSCHLTLESFSYNNQEVWWYYMNLKWYLFGLQVDMQWMNWTTPLSLLKKEIVLPDFVMSNYSTSLKHEVGFFLNVIFQLKWAFFFFIN